MELAALLGGHDDRDLAGCDRARAKVLTEQAGVTLQPIGSGMLNGRAGSAPAQMPEICGSAQAVEANGANRPDGKPHLLVPAASIDTEAGRGGKMSQQRRDGAAHRSCGAASRTSC